MPSQINLKKNDNYIKITNDTSEEKESGNVQEDEEQLSCRNINSFEKSIDDEGDKNNKNKAKGKFLCIDDEFNFENNV